MNEPNSCPYHRTYHRNEKNGWKRRFITRSLHFPQDVSKILQCKQPMVLPWMRQPPPPKIGKVMTVGSRGQILCMALTLIPIQTWITVSRFSKRTPFSRAISEVPKADHSSSFAPALIHHNEKVSKIYPAQPLKQRAGKVMTYEEDLQYMEEYYKWLEEDEQGEPHEVVLDDFMQKGWRQKEPCLVKRHFSWNSLLR